MHCARIYDYLEVVKYLIQDCGANKKRKRPVGAIVTIATTTGEAGNVVVVTSPPPPDTAPTTYDNDTPSTPGDDDHRHPTEATALDNVGATNLPPTSNVRATVTNEDRELIALTLMALANDGYDEIEDEWEWEPRIGCRYKNRTKWTINRSLYIFIFVSYNIIIIYPNNSFKSRLYSAMNFAMNASK